MYARTCFEDEKLYHAVIASIRKNTKQKVVMTPAYTRTIAVELRVVVVVASPKQSDGISSNKPFTVQPNYTSRQRVIFKQIFGTERWQIKSA